jgi:hypothetical protein
MSNVDDLIFKINAGVNTFNRDCRRIRRKLFFIILKDKIMAFFKGWFL